MRNTYATTPAVLIWLLAICLSVKPAIADASSTTKSKADNQPAKVKIVDKTTVDSPATAVSKKRKPIPAPNRRWIMKQRDYAGKKIPSKPARALNWRNPAQKKNCNTRLKPLAEAFERARFYSIQGDRCKTAQFARTFSQAAEGCQKACPEGFLEHSGYTEQVLRNMHQLQVLGTESCTGKQGLPPE